MKINTGKTLWERAKQIIPGGNQLLSKRPERFLPDQWPTYYQKASGCEVWDLDNNHYYDFASMGIGSCVLGYADPDVNKLVKQSIDEGNMCTLNTPDEIILAEKIVELHPWSEMVRFTRSGGEACAVGIRIARAASKKDLVLFSGYHGWHDWYISSNLSDETNLDQQLLSGLHPKGVPNALKGTSIPFYYNNIEGFNNLVKKFRNQIGVIIMEPRRDNPPDVGFLEAIRKAADELGAVLIFDEVTSGFRDTLGGIHLNLNVNPDMAIFGKAMGNGFPISAVIGKREIMDVAQDTFISSTYWTERIGFTAALAVINKMKQLSVIEQNMKYGEMIKNGWEKAAGENNIQIHINGLSSMPHLCFDYPNSEEVLTLYTQEMLKRGFLSSGALYMSYAYSESIIEKYLENSHKVFQLINKAVNSGEVLNMLNGPVRNFGFQRLN